MKVRVDFNLNTIFNSFRIVFFAIERYLRAEHLYKLVLGHQYRHRGSESSLSNTPSLIEWIIDNRYIVRTAYLLIILYYISTKIFLFVLLAENQRNTTCQDLENREACFDIDIHF